MPAERRHVIVGASAADTAAAVSFREHGYEREIVLVDAGTETPYERPPLTKPRTAGALLAPILPLHHFALQRIDLRLGTPVR